MKIPKNIDVVGKEAPACSKGTNPFDNPQIKPYESPIPDTPGEKAVNSTEPEAPSKGFPSGLTKGSGY